MEPWSISRYIRPRLRFDAISCDISEDLLAITADDSTYRIAFDDRETCEEFVHHLTDLQNPDSPVWKTIRESAPDSGWRTLASYLDTRSLIEDVGGSPKVTTEIHQKLWNDRVHYLAELLKSKTRSGEGPLIGEIASRLICDLESSGELVSDATFRGDTSPNFFLALLRVELSYLRVSAPPTYAAALSIIRALSASDNQSGLDASIGAAQFSTGLYDIQDFNAHLDLVVHCLIEAPKAGSLRLPTPNAAWTEPLSGIEFIRRAEKLVRTALDTWGTNRYVLGLIGLQDPASPLMKGCSIEEYHVTRRFVEMITPLLRKRLSKPLRSLMFRYYAEEIGHEAFEQDTCAALGITYEMLQSSTPLPLSSAFVDCLTQFAETSPLSFLSSVMVTEGMLGDPSIVGERLSEIGFQNPLFRDVSRRHDNLNKDLSHASIARLALQEIGAIDASSSQTIADRLMFVLELNQRAWNAIADYYGAQNTLEMYSV